MSSQKIDLHKACYATLLAMLLGSIHAFASDDECPPKKRNVLMHVLVGARTMFNRAAVARTDIDMSRIRSWHDLELGSTFYFDGEAQEMVFQGITGPRGNETHIVVSYADAKGAVRSLAINSFAPERARIRRRPGFDHDLAPPPMARHQGPQGPRADDLQLPTAPIRTPQEMQAAVLQNFAGTSGVSVRPAPHPLSVPVPPGFNASRVDVTFSPEDIQYARAAGLIYDNVPFSQLPRGHAYNYVVFEDGSILYGRVDDSWQFGVQIRTLAQSKRMNIRAAGEVLPLENGQYRFNNDSVYRALLENPVASGALPEQRIPLRVQNLFDRSLGRAHDAPSAGMLTRGTPLTPVADAPPTREHVLALCQNPYFLRNNSEACATILGAGR